MSARWTTLEVSPSGSLEGVVLVAMDMALSRTALVAAQKATGCVANTRICETNVLSLISPCLNTNCQIKTNVLQ